MVLKHVQEYRDAALAKQWIAAISELNVGPMRIMEVCGTHTMSIFRNGIPAVLPKAIKLISGPGCPVCVTAQKDMDGFVSLARQKEVILTTFGDLMRVPGSGSTLQQEKAGGRDVRIVYSVFDALTIALDNPQREVIFCAVGFETTIPTIAAAILMAEAQGLTNFSIHCAHKLTPPALNALLERPDVKVDAFLLPGHVSVITGMEGYREVFQRHPLPSVIAGFEPVDILRGIYMVLRQKQAGTPLLENGYERAVSETGNQKARAIMERVFDGTDAVWRGIGLIPDSGLVLKEQYHRFDALKKLGIRLEDTPEPPGCACGEILMGLKRPDGCPLYGKRCTPTHPVGPCMVSSEGTCAAYYKYAVSNQ